MWRRITVILMSVSVLFCVVLVKQAGAQTVDFGNSTFTPLFLDQGFMNRPVDLDLPAIDLNVKFTESDIPAPGVLTIITQKLTTESDTTGYGSEIFLYWTTNSALLPQQAEVTVYNPICGQDEQKQCAIQQSLNGVTEIITSEEQTNGEVRARVKINSKIKLILIPVTEPPAQDLGYMQQGDASWYAYKNCNCAASPDFPKGSYVKVTCLDDETKSVIVRINDFGPERDIFPNRVIDLDKVAFSKLASLGAGVIQVKVEPVDGPEPQIVSTETASQPIEPPPPEPEPMWDF